MDLQDNDELFAKSLRNKNVAIIFDKKFYSC